MKLNDILIPAETNFGEISNVMYIIRFIDTKNDFLTVECLRSKEVFEVPIDGVIIIKQRAFQLLQSNFHEVSWYKSTKDEFLFFRKMLIYSCIISAVGLIIVSFQDFDKTGISWCYVGTTFLIVNLLVFKNFPKRFKINRNIGGDN